MIFDLGYDTLDALAADVQRNPVACNGRVAKIGNTRVLIEAEYDEGFDGRMGLGCNLTLIGDEQIPHGEIDDHEPPLGARCN